MKRKVWKSKIGVLFVCAKIPKRLLAAALAAALLLTAALFAVAQGDPAYTIALELSAETQHATTLAAGEILPADQLMPGDLLHFELSVAADFPVYANYTVIYYDKTRFEPADAEGEAFTAAIQGAEDVPITDYLIAAANPLWASGTALGDLNVTNLQDYPPSWKGSDGALLPAYQSYAALALKIPYDSGSVPAPMAGESLFFGFYLRVKADAPPTAAGETADIFLSEDACRSYADRPNTAMYYCAAEASDSYQNVTIILSAPLHYTVEAPVQTPLTLHLAAGENGSLGVNYNALRNVPGATTFAELADSLALSPAEGYGFAGWAEAADYVANGAQGCTLLPSEEHLGNSGSENMSLVAVFRKWITLHWYSDPGALYAADTQLQGTAIDEAYLSEFYASKGGAPRKTGYSFVWDALPGAFEENCDVYAQWTPKQLRVTLVIQDLRKSGTAQQLPVLSLDLPVGSDFAAYVPNEATLLGYIEPIEAGSFYEFERFGPAQANDFYTVPATDEAEIFVPCGRVHRGTYYVTYDANGGTAEPATQEKLRGDTLIISREIPVYKGYSFLGWARSTAAQQVEFTSGSSYSADEDLKLYAVWSENPAPEIKGGGTVTLQYKGTGKLTLDTRAQQGSTTWDCDPKGIIELSQDGSIKALKRGSVTVTATDGDGKTARCTVTVNYVWWQWLIVIFLFGFLWY